ncbi:polyprenyl synthetase family protein [Notoacmeibacter ruber]|uniref:Octaprenyl diphosphate synthase n=1 Tax=Notoacmeibacter ruber TaxID=2670375 RepID=A0A3L7JAP4_9HYPH|nr:polyprenyl synthetase family protein [Notoacmeibacter ruber]RLQ87425.1 polyprenyl synthetase family protein [Notoacmeibacter ruber]
MTVAGSVEPLLKLTADAMNEVNELILSKAGSDVELIPEISNYLVTAGGKRLRPMLTIASASIFGYRGDDHVKLATAVEFMHTATLLHDDVVDESDMRRSRATARRIWGNQASVLVGDFLLGQAFRLMVDVGSLAALDVLSTAASVIAEGEVWQLSAARSMETTKRDYEAVIRAKTAALFSSAAEVGPIIAGANERERLAFRQYGDALGMAFQLVDDALDYGGSAATLGKNVGDDFREGKVTLPVILAYQGGNDEDRAFWRAAIEQGQNDEAALASAIERLERTSAVEKTVEEARLYGDKARTALSELPAGQWRDALDEVISFCIGRVV